MRTYRLYLTFLVPMILVLIGTFGYVQIEGWSTFDALYMTVITLTTVGYREIHVLSPAGEIFTMFLALGGVFTLFYASAAAIRAIVGGEFQKALGVQRMERSLAKMSEHYIVCGYGRMGRLICEEFEDKHQKYVVIDDEEDRFEGQELNYGLWMHGDATNDQVLEKAGVRTAKALVSVVGSDSANLYITMSTRLLSETIFIVARSEDESSEPKLIRAGANRVVSPYVLGGQQVAQAILRPAVLDFIDLATRTTHMALQIEEISISERSRLAGKALNESRLREDYGLIVVAIKKGAGQMLFNPPPENLIEADDTLVVLGDREHLDRLANAADK